MGWAGRWEGSSGWGTHVNPWLQYCKVISLQLIKIIGGGGTLGEDKLINVMARILRN